VLVAVRHQAAERVAFRVGYRVLEGGADNDEVFTFALLHYAVAGIEIDF
jgi:hypothetical protein